MNTESVGTKYAWGKAALLVFALLILVNLLILDIKVLKEAERRELKFATPKAEKTPGVPDVSTQQTPGVGKLGVDSVCPAACLEVISEATASVLAQATPAPKPVTAGSKVKEFYIPLGSGSTKSTDWVELPGVESVIDMDNYPYVDSIIFEASLRIPTGNGRVYAKLYNVTEQHDAWFSEVYAEGSSGYRAESGKIVLSPGRKLYRVIMKSTMGYEAILDLARIKILLE